MVSLDELEKANLATEKFRVKARVIVKGLTSDILSQPLQSAKYLAMLLAFYCAVSLSRVAIFLSRSFFIASGNTVQRLEKKTSGA